MGSCPQAGSWPPPPGHSLLSVGPCPQNAHTPSLAAALTSRGPFGLEAPCPCPSCWLQLPPSAESFSQALGRPVKSTAEATRMLHVPPVAQALACLLAAGWGIAVRSLPAEPLSGRAPEVAPPREDAGGIINDTSELRCWEARLSTDVIANPKQLQGLSALGGPSPTPTTRELPGPVHSRTGQKICSRLEIEEILG